MRAHLLLRIRYVFASYCLFHLPMLMIIARRLD